MQGFPLLLGYLLFIANISECDRREIPILNHVDRAGEVVRCFHEWRVEEEAQNILDNLYLVFSRH